MRIPHWIFPLKSMGGWKSAPNQHPHQALLGCLFKNRKQNPHQKPCPNPLQIRIYILKSASKIRMDLTGIPCWNFPGRVHIPLKGHSHLLMLWLITRIWSVVCWPYVWTMRRRCVVIRVDIVHSFIISSHCMASCSLTSRTLDSGREETKVPSSFSLPCSAAICPQCRELQHSSFEVNEAVMQPDH